MRDIVFLRLLAALSAVFLLTACGAGTHKTDSDAAGAPTPAPDLAFSPSAPPPSGPKDSDLARSVAAGALVPVTLNAVVDSSGMTTGFVPGVVSEDVKGPDGRVAIPAGSAATLFVRGLGKKGMMSEVDIGLYTINILGQQHSFTTGPKDAATLVFTENAGLGRGHTSVHLYYGALLPFKLDTAVQLR